MTENIPLSPSIYDGLDPVPQPKSAATEAFEALRAAVGRAKTAIEAGPAAGDAAEHPHQRGARSAAWFTVVRLSDRSCNRPSHPLKKRRSA